MKMKKISIVFAVICLCFMGCNKPSPKPYVILDTDLGSSTDDVFAIKKLCQYMKEGKCTLLGVICDRKGDQNAKMAKMLLTYYNCPDVPIGLERSYPDSPHIFINYCDSDNWNPEKKNWKSNSVWSKAPFNDAKYNCNIDAIPDGYDLYCDLLRKADDQGVDIVCIGFMTTLSRLLNTPEGIELVKKKVKNIYIMGSKFTSSNTIGKLGYNLGKLYGKEPSVSPIYSAMVFNNLPDNVNVVFSSDNVGESLGWYANETVINDFENDKSDPIYIIYHDFEPDSMQFMWDVLPVIECVEGHDNDYFTLSNTPGRIHINLNIGYVQDSGWVDSSRIVFTPDASGNIRFQISKNKQVDDFYKWFGFKKTKK